MSDHTTVAEALAVEHRRNESMRMRSGDVEDGRPLVRFLYRLIRDHLQPGQLEDLLTTIEQPNEPTLFSNGWLGLYSIDVADRLTATPD